MTLDGMTEADFNVWKHHPVSKVYLKYLEDWSSQYSKAMLDRWIAGHITLETEKELRGRILMLAELVELRFESIQKFYQTDEEDNEGTTSQVVAET